VIVSTFGPEGPTKCSGLEVMRSDAESLHGEFGGRFRLVQSSNELHQTPIGTAQDDGSAFVFRDAPGSEGPVRIIAEHLSHQNSMVHYYFSVSVCQPGLVHFPWRSTKISVTRPEVSDRLPSTSVSYKY
jgi:hypothetical protein